MIREILKGHNNPVLRQKSEPVTNFDSELCKLQDDMLETMYHSKGIGLAAVQIGVLKKVIVMDLVGDIAKSKENSRVFINAEILEHSDETFVYKEGCLSLPNGYANVTRPKTVMVRYQNINGIDQEEEFTGLLAVCIQHEIDHTNGILFTDHLSTTKRMIIIEKVHKKMASN